MRKRDGWCERVVSVCSGCLVVLLALDALSRRPWLIPYAICAIIVSVWFACREIGRALNGSPSSTIVSFIARRVPPVSRPSLDSDAAERSGRGVISSFVERKYVWPWYSRHISKEIAFPFACRELAERTIAKFLAISSELSTVDLVSDAAKVALKHCKEYKRSIKRLDKNGKGSVEDFYRYSHPTSLHKSGDVADAKSRSGANHCLRLIRTVLKELLPWELWDTPHARLLCAILSKRLVALIVEFLSDPARLRIWIKLAIETENSKKNPQIKLDDAKNTPNDLAISCETRKLVDDSEKEFSTQKPIFQVTAVESQIQSKLEPIDTFSFATLQPDQIDSSLRKRTTLPIDINQNGKKAKNCSSENTGHVKIYDKVIEGSIKTWDDNLDLDNLDLSLGQDLLASLENDMEFDARLGRLWDADATDSNEIWSPGPLPENSSNKPQHGLWFGEEDNLDMDQIEESPPKTMVHTNPIISNNFNIAKPLNIPNMKELQNLSISTVNHAKNKIGDLQDEAAGVMEGIFDLGIAGLKKGLRLTGIHDSQEIEKSCDQFDNPAICDRQKSSIFDETRISLPKVTIYEKNDETNHASMQFTHLVKQHRVSSQDYSVPELNKESYESKSKNDQTSNISPNIFDNADFDSPDYEEAKDLPSCIAKLRCLLQQKTGDITPITPEDILMDVGIEQKQDSDEKQLSSSIDSLVILPQSVSEFYDSEDSCAKPIFTENNIQRLDKLFTRTVTGVFNTIKTAVGGDSITENVAGSNDSGIPTYKPLMLQPLPQTDNWLFIQSDTDMTVLIDRLLVERRGYCVVEAAQDSLDMLNGTNLPPQIDLKSKTIADELDEMEMINKYPLWQMCIEFISITLEGAVQKDVIIKSCNNTIGEIMEKVLQENLAILSKWCKVKTVYTFQDLYRDLQNSSTDETQQGVENIMIEDLCNILLTYIPKLIVTLFGREELFDAIKILFESINYQTINRDLLFNLLDVSVHHFLKTCANHSDPLITPPPSA